MMHKIASGAVQADRWDSAFGLCKEDGLAQQFGDASASFLIREDIRRLWVWPHTAILIRPPLPEANRTVGASD